MKKTLKEVIGDRSKKVHFIFYKDGDLWYSTEDGFEFPVPISDIGNATFLAEDKAILFMRYIRKHLQNTGQLASRPADSYTTLPEGLVALGPAMSNEEQDAREFNNSY